MRNISLAAMAAMFVSVFAVSCGVSDREVRVIGGAICDADIDCGVDEFCNQNDVCEPFEPGTPAPREQRCGDGVDNDNDGRVDCADSDCADTTVCRNRPPTGVPEESLCEDGVDNDGDGRTDCADTGCANSTACGGTTPPIGGGNLEFRVRVNLGTIPFRPQLIELWAECTGGLAWQLIATDTSLATSGEEEVVGAAQVGSMPGLCRWNAVARLSGREWWAAHCNTPPSSATDTTACSAGGSTATVTFRGTTPVTRTGTLAVNPQQTGADWRAALVQ